jgi:hypothetical protein
MCVQSAISRWSTGALLALALATGLAQGQRAAACPLANITGPQTLTGPCARDVPRADRSPLPTVLAIHWSFDTAYHVVESQLGNQKRMLQFGVIAACVALYFLTRSRA